MSDTLLVALVCGVLGLLIGSFLNVVIWRVPRDESLISPPSACPGCGARIRPYDNIPVLSWVLLRGRCRSCGEPISRRYPLVELATGVLFAGVAAWSMQTTPGLSWALAAYLYLAAISVALFMIDLDVYRLPNSIVLPSYVVLGALLTLASATEAGWPPMLRAAIGMAALYAFYFFLMVLRPGGMGFGDVKLAGVLGMVLAWHSWAAFASGAFLGFLLGGVLSSVLLLARVVTRKTPLPYGPFMLVGAFGGLFFGAQIAEWYLGLSGL